VKNGTNTDSLPPLISNLVITLIANKYVINSPTEVPVIAEPSVAQSKLRYLPVQLAPHTADSKKAERRSTFCYSSVCIC